MNNMKRRGFLGSAAIGAGGLIAAKASAEGQTSPQDGHAAGRDAAPFANGMVTVPRKPGDAPGFVASLDRAAIKATSGGWAREITARQLPIATGIAMAHLFLNPGGSREMHWHNSAEWAYVIAGQAQVTIVDPDGSVEVFNVAAGDLWYFPAGYPHAIQTIGSKPCHALLAFDDGLYSEHGTFGISDWMSRVEAPALRQALGLNDEELAVLPPGETYIMQGDIIPLDSAQAAAEQVRTPERSRRFGLLTASPAVTSPGGTIHVASAHEFPASEAMTGLLIRLAPGSVQTMHWHPAANEMHYVVSGRAKVAVFGPDKHLAMSEIAAGDCAYVPRNAGHHIQAIGPDPAELIAVQDAPFLAAADLANWIAQAPPHLLANNLHLDPRRTRLGNRPPIVEAS